MDAQNFSQWSIAQRLPRDIVDIDNMAAAMGPEIYEILGISSRIPNSKELNTIVSNWHRLDDAKRLQMEEYFLNLLKEE